MLFPVYYPALFTARKPGWYRRCTLAPLLPPWHATLDTLRAPRATAQSLTDWRREAAIRPVVFADAEELVAVTARWLDPTG